MQDKRNSFGRSDRRSSFLREAIVKLFKNASRWSWHDDDFIGSIVEILPPLLFKLGINRDWQGYTTNLSSGILYPWTGLGKWYILVRTSMYQYETVQVSTRIPRS